MAEEKAKDEEDKKDAKEDAAEGEEGEAVEGEEGAEGAEGDGVKKGKFKKLGKKKLLIIIIALVVVLGGAAGGAYFMGFIGGGGSSHESKGSKKESAKKAYLDLPEFLVNLNTSSRSSSFLKMTIALELADEKDKATLEANMPRILDSFNAYLRELRPSDLYGSAGLYRLREELMTRINKIIAPAQVNDLLFKQILIQ